MISLFSSVTDNYKYFYLTIYSWNSHQLVLLGLLRYYILLQYQHHHLKASQNLFIFKSKIGSLFLELFVCASNFDLSPPKAISPGQYSSPLKLYSIHPLFSDHNNKSSAIIQFNSLLHSINSILKLQFSSPVIHSFINQSTTLRAIIIINKFNSLLQSRICISTQHN